MRDENQIIDPIEENLLVLYKRITLLNILELYVWKSTYIIYDNDTYYNLEEKIFLKLLSYIYDDYYKRK